MLTADWDFGELAIQYERPALGIVLVAGFWPAPDPALVRAVLEGSPGITLARSFGPTVGAPAVTTNHTDEGDARVVTGYGLSTETGSVDVYDVRAPAGYDAGGAELLTDPKIVVGDPTTGLRRDVGSVGATTGVVAEDAQGYEGGQVLTDTTQRRPTRRSSTSTSAGR